jgi:hypothetical protein
MREELKAQGITNFFHVRSNGAGKSAGIQSTIKHPLSNET